ncbi:MAG: TolC family protein [Nevskia sp.]|nr:TolC family protein [Nevskia sp.]
MKRLAASGMAALVLAFGGAQAGELGALLHDALAHPAIAARQAQVQAAQSQVDAAGARYLGSGTASVDQSTYESSRYLGVFNPPAFSNPAFARTQFRYGAEYRLPVDLFGAIAATRAAAQQDLAAAELALRQETLMKLHQTVTAYARLLALRTQEQALAVQRQRVMDTLDRVTVQVQTGALGITDLKLAQSELAQVESERVRLDGERTQALATLKEITGIRQPPALAALAVPAWDAASPERTLPAQIADAHARAAEAQARAARRALWPSVSAVTDYYRYDGGGHDQDTWSVGARVSLPLDFGAWRQTAAADAVAQAARDRRAAAQRQAESQLATLKAAYDAALAEIAALQSEVDYREQVAAVQNELAAVGAISVEDRLRHARQRAEAEARLAQARAQAVETWSAAQVLSGIDPERYIRAIDATAPD